MSYDDEDLAVLIGGIALVLRLVATAVASVAVSESGYFGPVL